MKAAVYYGAQDIKVEDIEVPQIGPGDILVKVKACGICGSDLHSYQHGIFSRPGWVMGHEVSGEVVAAGEKVEGIKIGDGVVPMAHDNLQGCGQCFWCQREQPQWCPSLIKKPCGECEFCKSGQFYLCNSLRPYQLIGYGRNGGYSEYIIVSRAVLNQNVFKLPASVSFEEGAFVEPLQGAFHWVSLAEPESRDTAVVLGAGTVGLLVMQLLKNYVSRVIVCEVSPLRLRLARELGADVVIDASAEESVQRVMDITGTGRSYSGKGGACADIVMECSGVGVALQQALEMTRTGGKIVLVGLFDDLVAINPNRIIHKQLKVISSFAKGKLSRSQETTHVIDLITSGKVKLRPLITHELGLDKIREAFETQARPDQSVKVLIKP